MPAKRHHRNSAPATGSAPRQPRMAQSPFDDKELADIIIATSDGVDFYLPKVILSLSSPFFRQTFAIPQPTKESEDQSLDRVPVSEDSETFDVLMRLTYPMQNPTVQTISVVAKVLEAAMKYEMEEATRVMKETLGRFLKQQPLQVYTIACRLLLEKEAGSAAAIWKTKFRALRSRTSSPFASTPESTSYIPEMSNISAADYYRLLKYCRSDQPTTFTLHHPVSSAKKTDFPTPSDAAIFSAAGAEADITLRSSDGILFPVHSVVLRLASAVMLLEGEETGGGLKEIPVKLDSYALNSLLKFCYPLMSRKDLDLVQICAVLDAALRYKMSKIEEVAHELMMSFVDTQSLSVYLMASAKGWKEEAQEAARHAVAQGGLDDVYVPEMEVTPASTYRSLLEFRHAYILGIRESIKEQFPYASNVHAFSDYQLMQAVDRKVRMPLLHAMLQTGSTCAVCGAYRALNYGDATCGLCYANHAAGLVGRSDEFNARLKTKISEISLVPEPDS